MTPPLELWTSPLELPPPVEATLAALAREAARPNWDGEGGVPVEARAWEDARHILAALPDSVLTGPDLHLSMSGDGHVHITLFRANRGRATIETAEGYFLWTWVKGLDESEAHTLPTLESARAALARFAF